MKFMIECELGDRWFLPFIAMLEEMEYQGNIGHSGFVGMFADGDGDFQPKFRFKTNRVKPCKKDRNEVMFDRSPEESA